MNMAPVARMPTLQLQELVFDLELEQKSLEQLAVDTSEPHRLCFLLFSSSRASFECSASTDGFIILPLLLHVESFPLSSSLPRGIAVHMPGVDRGIEKPVDDCLHGNVEEYASVYEREWELFSLCAFLSPSLFFSLCFCFFPSSISP